MLAAWKEFVRGKRGKDDVQEFQHRLMDNILALHRELAAGTYKHGAYKHFRISDPKPRDIHKAMARDRVVHHALHRILYPFFDRTFIADSYSCRKGKGTHRAMNRFRQFAFRVSRNNKKTCHILKCDIRKFFASIDHTILMSIIRHYISDRRTLQLIAGIVGSFNSGTLSTGLPLGNLTSQLLVNVYMNEFDQFAKHTLKAKYYIRYADDFVVLSHDKQLLESMRRRIAIFLHEQLKLELHPDKVFIKTFASGVDFLGWVHFPRHRVLRTTTKRRMLKRATGLEEDNQIVQSYVGLLGHGNAKKLRQKMLEFS